MMNYAAGKSGWLMAGSMVVAMLGTALAAEKPAWEDRPLPEWKSTVPADAVKLEGGTEIQWKPLPFEFVAGKSVRYIDFDKGDDANTGQTREQAWKHHPWDANATAKAKAAEGVQTYVFKRGVEYHGALVADESGTADQPISLTSDPAWGEGDALIAGSQAITGGWKKVSAADAKAAGFPTESNGKLWSVKVDGDFTPWALWVADKTGARTRVPIARWPNWKAEHEYNIFTQWFRVESVEKGFPETTIYAPKVLNDPDKDAYKGATVWMDHANTSGEFSIIGPFPSKASAYDPKTGRLKIAITHPRRHPNANAPFYLENLAKFLDEAGEWYMSTAGDNARTLYVRLPGDADPNSTVVEVAQHAIILDIKGQQHIDISGLTFTGGNARDLNDAPRAGNWERPDNYTQMAAIRLNNNTQNVRLHHLLIRDTAGCGVVHFVNEQNTTLSDVEIADSRFENIDNEAIHIASSSAPIKSPPAHLTDLRILRNRLIEIGLRCSGDQGGRGIDITGLRVGHISGNVINRTGGQGINVVGARMAADVPLVRIQIDRNQVKDTLLQKQDFGGIEFWGLGPAYVYNNISINPVGFVAHRNVYHKNEAFYFDHGAKGYLFNNIGWSDSREDAHRGILGDVFFKEVRNRWNQAFNNTSYNFRSHYNHEGVHGDQQHYLGNLAIKTTGSFQGFWRLDDAAEIAFSRNLIAGGYSNIYGRWKGDAYRTIDEMQQHVAGLKNQLATDIGWVTDDMPVVDPEKHDFRLTDNSAAIDRGVKVFIPWSLYGTVGEWHFRLHPKDPNTVLAYDVYPQPHMLGHGSFRMGSGVPENELIGTGFTAEQYTAGILEDWVPGAVSFDGARSFSLANERLIQNFSIGEGDKKQEINGTDRKTVRMTDNNFAIEAVVRVEAGQAGGTIAGKLGEQAGYALLIDASGRPALRVRASGVQATQSANTPINDGRWHHVLAEFDRAAGKMTLYVDGIAANGSLEGAPPAAGASLDNPADFVVGEKLVGALDFLRVSRGTLADARTTIDELMAWQFNGPPQHDFVDRPPTGGIRDIGAIEHPAVSGQKAINYTPPAPLADATPVNVEPAESDTLKTGPDRTVSALDWGTVSAPKQAKVGDKIDIQVVFGTETIEKAQKLCIDLHARSGGSRTPGFGRPKPIDITPGSTKPYTVTWGVRQKDGLDGVTAVIYVSPDGSWSKKTLSTEVTIDIVGGDTKDAKSDAKDAKNDAKGDAKDAKADAPDAGASAIKGPSKTETFDWGTITATKDLKVGQEAVITVTLAEGIVTEATVLTVDMHWWKGQARSGVAGRFGTRKVKPGETGPFVFKKEVPDKEGIAAIAAVVSLSPDGSWGKKTHTGELGMKVSGK